MHCRASNFEIDLTSGGWGGGGGGGWGGDGNACHEIRQTTKNWKNKLSYKITIHYPSKTCGRGIVFVPFVRLFMCVFVCVYTITQRVAIRLT